MSGKKTIQKGKKPSVAGAGSAAGSGPSGLQVSVRVKAKKNRTESSRRWLERQLNDPYVLAAQRDGYRSRAAYKLLQLNEKVKFLRPGQRVVDLGAAPGGWTQVVSNIIGPQGYIVALDILPMDPLPHVTMLHVDFTADGAEAQLFAALNGQADVVLSDMAPPTTGHTATDHLRIMGLAELAYDYAARVLAPQGVFICKLFQGGADKDLLATLKNDFKTVRHVKPAASRADSAELYIVATGFRK